MILAPTLSLSAGSGAAIARPTFSRDFAGEKTLNNGTGPAITFTRASNATFFDASGTLQTAANDTPRFDHDPATGASRGLLIEESRTNSLPNSQMTGIAAGSAGTAPTGWSVTGSANGLTRTIATSTVNGMTVFDVTFAGTVTGGPINITLDPQSTTAGYSAASGQTWTGSIYAALLSGSIPSGSSFDFIVRGRKSDNTAPSPTDQGSIVITPTASLTRYSATRTFNNADTTKVTLDIRVTSVADAASVNFTLRIAAPQLEQGAFATSYIPTTTAAATRAADSAVVTPISSFYNQAEGTLFAEVRENGFGALYGVASLDTDTSDNRIDLRRSNDVSNVSVFVTTGGVGQATLFRSLPIAAQTYRLIGAYAANDIVAVLNGGAATTDTSATLPTLTHLKIGSLSAVSPATGVAFRLNGHIRKIAYWPRRLSNSLLQQLTT
jgi:hypothetical protein